MSGGILAIYGWMMLQRTDSSFVCPVFKPKLKRTDTDFVCPYLHPSTQRKQTRSLKGFGNTPLVEIIALIAESIGSLLGILRNGALRISCCNQNVRTGEQDGEDLGGADG
jgi:hypothetical protein